MSMNIFRMIADMMHLASFIILFLKMHKTRSAAGISFKSQCLYATVFCTRYLDLFTNHISIYNTIMKIFFISSTLYIVYAMKTAFKATWDPKIDTMRVEFLVVPAAVLALIINERFRLLDILWAFSIYLEAVAILPQLFQLARTGEAETITAHYLFALGGYRALYIVNWIYRYVSEGRLDWISIVGGLVQTALYSDFLYIYITRGTIYTTRLFLKRGILPKWAQRLWNVSEAFIMEQSIVRPTDKIMITVTRNLSHTKIMLVEETQVIRPLPEDPVNMTQIQASARIISNTGWDSVKSRIEQFGISKGRANMYKSAQGLKHVLETISSSSSLA